MKRPVVACLWPDLDEFDVDITQFITSRHSVEVIYAPYRENSATRRARAASGILSESSDTPSNVIAALRRADVIIARDVPIGTGSFSKAKWLHCVYAGVEHLRGAGLDQTVVTNSAGAGSRSIAEFVVARLLAHWKHLHKLDELQRDGVWEPRYGGVVAGKEIVVVGLGAIGSSIAALASGLGMRVIGVRRRGPIGGIPPGVSNVVGPEGLLSVLGRCDAVVLAAPSTMDTFRLISDRELQAMPRGSVLCNVSRGALVDEQALCGALHDGHLGAAILDVFDQEPLPSSSPLWTIPNAYISSHCSIALTDYVTGVLNIVDENLGYFLSGTALRNVVDASVAL